MTNPLNWWNSLGRPLACLPRWGAIAMLAALLATMGWSAIAVASLDRSEAERAQNVETPLAAAPVSDVASTGDLALYQRVADRVTAGEGYYVAAMQEHRARNYPVRPFVTVRLPTMAFMQSLIGSDGVRLLSIGLLIACLWAADRRLSSLVSAPERIVGVVLLLLGGAGVAAARAGLVHEVLAGLLLTLSFLLYRRHRWWPSLLAAAAAIAVRELAVHFVLLWLALALAGQRWREVSALFALLAVFAAGMALHYWQIEALRLPGDAASQGWAAAAGYALPLLAVCRLTALLTLPLWLAAPLAILPFMGWVNLGGRPALFAALWFAGFFTAMALFARPENFYWAQLLLPAYFAGLAFAPRAIADLLRTARGAVQEPASRARQS